MTRILLPVLTALLIGGVGLAWLQPWQEDSSPADPGNHEQVTLGRVLYATHCGFCHGERLQGQPDWQTRNAAGRLPAPPHDATGHTWHHPDEVLFGITKNGIAAYAGAGYQSDMPAFAGTLSDAEIRAVLAYIKSAWPPDIRAKQDEITRLSQR